MNHLLRSSLGTLLAAGFLLAAKVGNTQLAFTVSMDTSSLVGSVNGPFSLDFQLTDGSGANDGNNTATVSNFQFGGGGATGSPTASGGASGDITSGVTLTDNSFFNELYQTFTAGTTLSFDVNLTTNVDSGGTPDEFSFAILGGSLNNIPTDGFGAFVVVDINSRQPVIQTFAASPPYDALGTPLITITGSTVPEPTGVAFLVSAACVACLTKLARRRK